MPDQSRSGLPDIYGHVVASFALGMIRFWGAEAAAARLMLALLSFRSEPPSDLSLHPHKAALENLAKIPYDSYDALAYVTNISHLVYATTLLDTFISDTTLFLLLRFPRAMGTKRQVSLQSVLEASSVHDVLTAAAIRKAREVAFLTFVERLDYLREAFGLRIELESDIADALVHYPSVRNTAVHDQGVFEFRLDEHGVVVSRRKTCPRHPTQVTGDDVSKAAQRYRAVAGAVAQAVFSQVLKVEDHPSMEIFRAPREDGGSSGV